MKFVLLLIALAATCSAQYLELKDAEGRNLRAVLLRKGDASVEIVRDDGAVFVVPLEKFSEDSRARLVQEQSPDFTTVVHSTRRNRDWPIPNALHRIVILSRNEPLVGFYSDEIEFLRSGLTSALKACERRARGELATAGKIDILDERVHRARKNGIPVMIWQIDFLDAALPVFVPAIYEGKIFSTEPEAFIPASNYIDYVWDTKSRSYRETMDREIMNVTGDPFAPARPAPVLDRHVAIPAKTAVALLAYLKRLKPSDEIRKAVVQ